MKQLKLALSFLTVIPMRIGETLQPSDLGRSAAWFPAVGLLIGLLLAAARYGLAWIFPNPVPGQATGLLPGILLVALWAGLTGGLHLDGLADCCDGMLAAVSSERRLEIMKDPRLGTFGGAGLALHLLVKAGALAVLPAGMILPLLLAPILARWLILIVARQPMARQGGLGAEFAAGVTWRTFLFAAIIPVAVIAAGGLRTLAAAALAHVVALGVIRLARVRLGGVTGDVLGLTIELSEAVVLLAYAAR